MIGQRIKKYLDERGIKQTFLAQQTGLTDQIISDICNRDRKVEAMEYFKICKALDVPLETFYEE
jgi:transcriptional regulator with XRE-family HTH domain